MDHRIPQPLNDNEIENLKRKDSMAGNDILKTQTEDQKKAQAAFYRWLSPENIKKYDKQNIIFSPTGLIAASPHPPIARAIATDQGYGYSNTYCHYIHQGLLDECSTSDSKKLAGSIIEQLKSALLRLFS